MNWDKDIQNSLDAHLSGLHVSERQQAQMFNRIVRGEQPIMKKKISAALVFAIVMMIAMGSMALAAGLGLFGHFRQTQENNNGWKSWRRWPTHTKRRRPSPCRPRPSP